MTNNGPKNTKAFEALLLIAFIMPWPHGGEIVWQYLLFTTGIFTLATVYFINNSQTLVTNFTNLNSIKTPLILLGAWLIFQILQIIPLPTNFLNMSEQSFHTNEWPPLSVATNATIIELLKNTSYITIFTLALLLLNTKQRILKLTSTLFISSAIITMYSLIDFYSAGKLNIIDPLPPWDYYSHNAIHGTFSYKNHLASFLILTIPLGFGLIFTHKPTKANTSKTLLAMNLILSKHSFVIFFSILMITTLVLNSSRAGNAALLLSFMTVMTYLTVKKRKSITRKKALSSLVVTFSLLLIILFSGVADKLVTRYENESDNGREKLRTTAISVFKQHPIVGSGAGTFPVIHQQYKSSELSGSIMWQRVHNDYLEMLSNQGIIGFLLLASAIALLFLTLLKGINLNNRSLTGLQLACITSSLAILIHSLMDFNFQLPVNAVYFYLILAIGIKIPLVQRSKNNKQSL